jgi:hypothetical protein
LLAGQKKRIKKQALKALHKQQLSTNYAAYQTKIKALAIEHYRKIAEGTTSNAVRQAPILNLQEMELAKRQFETST